MGTKIKKIRENLIIIADIAKENYDDSKDLKAALVAIKAYSEVTKTAIAQVQYKKLTGMPIRVAFLEE